VPLDGERAGRGRGAGLPERRCWSASAGS